MYRDVESDTSIFNFVFIIIFEHFIGVKIIYNFLKNSINSNFSLGPGLCVFLILYLQYVDVIFNSESQS